MPKLDVISTLPKQKSEKEVTSTLPHDEVDKFFIISMPVIFVFLMKRMVFFARTWVWYVL